MIIKKICSILIIVLLTLHNITAQDIKQDTFFRSIGIDATFINNFLPLNNTIGARSVYLVHYIKYKANNKFTRHGFNIDILGSFKDNESEVDRKDARFKIDYKISKGKRRQIFRKGNVLFGGEGLFDYLINRRSLIDPNDPNLESTSINLDQLFQFMIGPFFGFEYEISKRFSIYTEAGFYLFLEYGIDTFTSEFDSERDFKDRSFNVQEVFSFPRSIILFYSF